MRRTLSRIIILVLILWLIGYGANPYLVQADSPAISASASSGAPGRSIIVTGSGFSANETAIAVAYDGTAIASGILANAQGGWNATFSIPPSPAGPHIIDAYGSSTLATSVPDITFTVTPSISINQASGTPGSSVTIVGSGFSASETGIAVTYDGTAVTSSISANAQGGWNATFVVPASPAGSHIIDAYGSSTSATSVPDMTFTVTPGISVNRTNGAPGSSVSVTGFSFSASETGIAVTYDGTEVASGIPANAQGGWKATFVVPASPAGSHIIDAYGSSTSATSVSDITFTVTPGISVNRTNGAPGSSVSVTGFSFSASETGIAVTYDGTAVASGISANAQGGWSATFVVPALPSGPHIIDAYGSSTSAISVPDMTFTVTAGISTNRTGGAPGDSVTVTGSGFAAGETGITVTYDGTEVASGIPANAQGGWKATFVVPASASGPHSIGAYGSVTQATSTSEASFNIGPGISVDPDHGNVGETVDVAGSGFAANSPLRFTYDGEEILTQRVITDSSGSFSSSVMIPKSPHGPHTIKVVDGQKSDSAISFTMESTPPAVPRLLSPGDGNRLGILGGIKPAFKWSIVTDPSGVAYVLQVDTSPDFSQPILERTDISGSRYTLTSAEALLRGEYYWRLKAVDGASNESSWSQPWLLRSGLMALWTLVTIILLMVAVIGVVVYFFVVRRLTRRRWEGIPVPEAEMPRVVPGQWRMLESGESSRERPLPLRLALPQPAKRGKVLSTEDMARVKVIIDFAQSLPLVKPGYNADWLVDLAETSTGGEASTPVSERLLKNEIQVRYEPAWMRHPLYQDLTALLQGQPILQDLNTFVDSANRCASEATLLLQEIYHDAIAEIPSDFLQKGGWGFISAVYSDTLSWFLGKSLRGPSERDYVIKRTGSTGEETGAFYLWGEEATSFAVPLIEAVDESEALRFRTLHLRLRQTYRNSDKARQLVGMMTQSEVQQGRLVSAFRQFDRFTQ